MRLLLSLEDHYGFLDQCVLDKPGSVKIATYGVWAGIMANGNDTTTFGPKFQSRTRAFLDQLKAVEDVNILVGNYEYKSCKKNARCEDCENQYILGLLKLINHADFFSGFKWRVSTQSHVKCAIFRYEDHLRGLTGGRNLTDSSWADASVELDKMTTIRLDNHFNEIWRGAHLLTSTRIGQIMEEQKISEATVQKILESAA